MATNAIGQAIKHIREDRGWSLRDLEAKLHEQGHDLSHSAIHNRERGHIKTSPPDRRAFAKAFGMSLEDFDKVWRGSTVARTVEGEGIPVINKAPAGVVLDYAEWGCDSGQGVENIDRGAVEDELAFAVVVVGDSMEPRISEGDYIVFSPMNVPRPRATLDVGKVVFVRVGPSAKRPGCFVARYEGTDGKVLRFSKDNPKYKQAPIPRELIEQLAVAVELRSKRL